MQGFARYLTSLAGSWQALCHPRANAYVASGQGFVVSRHPDVVLNNAVVLEPDAVEAAAGAYAGIDVFALWSLDTATAVAVALEAAGFARDISTRPMVLDLADHAAVASGTAEPTMHAPVVRQADPAIVADLNGVSRSLLRDVPGLHAYVTADHRSGLVLIDVDTDVNVSFVATHPEARRRGLARTVTRAALLDARRRGSQTATLQATPMAEPMYASLGFRAVGRWQEWTPRIR